MNSSVPIRRDAGPLDAGARCPHCNKLLELGEPVAACGRCGAVHHASCWSDRGGCGTFDCAPPRRELDGGNRAEIRVTAEEALRAAPLPPVRPAFVAYSPITPARPRSRYCKTAIAAFVVAVAGILLFGIVTGLVAVILGSLALGTIYQTRQRGKWLAAGGLLLGLVDMIGWIVFLSYVFSHPQGTMLLNEMEPDVAAMEHLAPQILRAVKANVLIESSGPKFMIGMSRIGSGVVVRVNDDHALVVTNRHVVDPKYSDNSSRESAPELPGDPLQVKLLGQPAQSSRVVWLAPNGIDLALVDVPFISHDSQAAPWKADQPLTIGEDVFTIGNPLHLDWSLTRGGISQIRSQHFGDRKIQIIQTDAALNFGNSGGGLYNKDGMLIGINTWVNDKRDSEGLGFAISWDTLLGLDPPPLREEKQLEKP
jgi:S1-C subfamily serine protease